MSTVIEDRIRRLSEVSARSVIEPDAALPGSFGDGQVLPDELLSVSGLPLAGQLTPEQRARLSREEIAAIVEEGLRFEAVLLAGFGLEMSHAPDLTDERIEYLLHELGEETRHSRLFVRVLDQLQPRGTSPFNRGPLGVVKRLVIRSILDRPALFVVLVLAGEEIPDLFQKLSSDHPDTDPFLREVNRYHRQEEARHLAFARAVLPERWAQASWWERFRVRWHAPLIIEVMFDMLRPPRRVRGRWPSGLAHMVGGQEQRGTPGPPLPRDPAHRRGAGGGGRVSRWAPPVPVAAPHRDRPAASGTARRKARTSALKRSVASMSIMWPTPGMTTSSEPGIRACSGSQTYRGARTSRSPHISNVGTSTSARTSRRSASAKARTATLVAAGWRSQIIAASSSTTSPAVPSATSVRIRAGAHSSGGSSEFRTISWSRCSTISGGREPAHPA
jgi:hypothetical protein